VYIAFSFFSEWKTNLGDASLRKELVAGMVTMISGPRKRNFLLVILTIIGLIFAGFFTYYSSSIAPKRFPRKPLIAPEENPSGQTDLSSKARSLTENRQHALLNLKLSTSVVNSSLKYPMVRLLVSNEMDGPVSSSK
jgi:hypothetical protein